jgi:cyanophycinase
MKKKSSRSPGTLVIVGGNEDKTGAKEILGEIARRTQRGKLIICTAASQVGDVIWPQYYEIFKAFGLKHVEHLDIEQPDQAREQKTLNLLNGAKTIFFTGGDQLKITTKLGGTPVVDFVFDLYDRGGTVAGTSAGASVMGKTMLVGGENAESHKVGNWMMAPGLGLAEDMIFDQHFAQRGRIGRLLGAVALNPGILGIGIDEDTSIILEGKQFTVMGTNAVYVVDGREVTYTNISEATPDLTMSMHDVRLHILADKEVFNLESRRARQKARGKV